MSQAMIELVRQHRDCDDRLSLCETALGRKDLETAISAFRLFALELEEHLSLEEDRLFPAFERVTGITTGPTAVMRSEHAEMRELTRETAVALEAGDVTGALAVIDTLNVLIQQHNIKEENVLYPMCAGSIPELAAILGMGAKGSCGCSCACASHAA